MAYVTETYLVYYKGKKIGYYFNHDDGTVMYRSYETPCEYEEPLHMLGLDKTYEDITEIPFFTALLSEEHRVKGKRQLIWQDGDVIARAIRTTLPCRTMHRIMRVRKHPRVCGNGHRGTSSGKWTTAPFRRSLTKPGGGAAATMTAVPSGWKSRRNGWSCPMQNSWGRW